jgi:histidinol-phosphate/aromatic aminotransferase/cobyric acid decarboxylase-like protein
MWRDLLRSPSPRVHGGLRPSELHPLGIDPAAVLDLSVNVNPYGPHPDVVDAIQRARLDVYPDPEATAVREALGARWSVTPERVAFGNGASELLWALAHVLVPGGGRLLLVEPAFSELRAAAEAAGASIASWRAEPASGLVPDLAILAREIDQTHPAVVALATPTSPSGAAVPHDAILSLAFDHPRIHFLLDESFLSLSDGHADLDEPLPDNVLRVRSMTKDHALPGLRVGYLLAPPELVRAVDSVRQAWPTGTLAQAAALAAVALEPFVAESRSRLRSDRRALAKGLRTLGYAPLPSTAPYLVFDAGDAAALRARLLRRGVLVRDCASFGLPGFIRVAARPEPDRERLLEALAQEQSALGGGGAP